MVRSQDCPEGGECDLQDFQIVDDQAYATCSKCRVVFSLHNPDCECAICPKCDGWGYVYTSSPNNYGLPGEQVEITCDICDGIGLNVLYTDCDC